MTRDEKRKERAHMLLEKTRLELVNQQKIEKHGSGKPEVKC